MLASPHKVPSLDSSPPKSRFSPPHFHQSRPKIPQSFGFSLNIRFRHSKSFRLSSKSPFLTPKHPTLKHLKPMAKTKPGVKKELEFYTIHGTSKTVKVGDCVLMRPLEAGKPPYVARLEKIESDAKNHVKVRVRWYYRPEESLGGRRQFHGAKELFLSDHFDTQHAQSIEGKCIVHSFKNYTKLVNVGPEDYFCRFEYKAATGGFTPDRVAVYCKCEMPYNPDDLMVQCDGCKDWFHPSCMGMTIEHAKNLENFSCADCSAEEDVKRLPITLPVEPKAEPKRRRK